MSTLKGVNNQLAKYMELHPRLVVRVKKKLEAAHGSASNAEIVAAVETALAVQPAEVIIAPPKPVPSARSSRWRHATTWGNEIIARVHL